MDVFDHMVTVTKAHAREAVLAYRGDRPTPTPTSVWLLWAGEKSVLGVYGSEGAAVEVLALLPESIPAWIERRVVG